MRTVCRGDCPRYAVPKRFGAMYANGFGWCCTCSAWFDLGHGRCPCCALPLRRRPRSKAGVGVARGGQPLPPVAVPAAGPVRRGVSR